MGTVNLNITIAAILMTAGSFIVLYMLSDALFAGLIYLGEAFNSWRTLGRKASRQKLAVLRTGITLDDINGMSGMAIPLVFFLFATGLTIIYVPGSIALWLYPLYGIWTVFWGCKSNISYNDRCSRHSGIFIRKFFAAYAAKMNTKEALAMTFSSMPNGFVKSAAKTAYGSLNHGTKWNTAIKAFANGTYSGNCIALYLDYFENSDISMTDELTASFSKDLQAEASLLQELKNSFRAADRKLMFIRICYSIIAVSLILTGMTGSAALLVMYLLGIVLLAFTILNRNSTVSGDLI